MTDALLETRALRKAFGALIATDQVDFDVRAGETHAVIGPNGAGKTTFIKQLSGELRPDAGKIRFGGEDITSLAAPSSGPAVLAMPPRITMNISSPERVQFMNSGVRKAVWLASSAPASPHMAPEMMNAVRRYG